MKGPRVVGPLFGALVVVGLLLFAWPGLGAPSAPAAPSANLRGAAPAAVLPPAASALVPAVHPAVNCPPLYPQYSMVGNVWAITPAQLRQSPCPLIAQDEAHGSFFSNVSGSGEAFTLPLRLPAGNSSQAVAAVGGFYVGMVVSGDPNSAWKQSYAAVTFQPQLTSFNYTENVAIFSLLNASFFPGGGCPTTVQTMNFSWNGTYWCEVDEIAGGAGATMQPNLPPGTFLNVTFLGQKGGSGALQLWVNSSAPGTDANWTFNPTTDNAGQPALVGDYSFEPGFRASCPINCVLNWSMPFGLGFGVDMCPGASLFASCNSYNQYTWVSLNPLELGPAEFLENGSYSGDYAYLSPESASGVCNTQITPGTVAGCFNFDAFGGTGYYPIFTFNGSELDFGTNYSYTQQDFGGVNFQYLANAQTNLLIPFFLDEFTNDSRDGFIAANTALNVSVRLGAVGSVTGATLYYSLGGGPTTSEPLTLMSGNDRSGVYNATIPSTGGNGVIRYWVNATDQAGSLRSSPVSLVQRGPLPTFQVSVQSDPSGCGRVNLNGTTYLDGAVANLLPGFYPAHSTACYPYIFGGWRSTAGLSLDPAGAPLSTLGVSASGTVNASWVYVRPYDAVKVQTNPGACGQVAIDNNTYTDGDTVYLLDSLSHYLVETAACSSTPSFAGWTFNGTFSILGTSFVPYGNGTLTANFIASTSAHTVTFYTSPTDCGGVLFQGAGYTNGESINVLLGSYAVDGVACAHFGFRNLSSSSALSLSPGSVDVTGAGWIRATQYHLTEVTIATSPAGCGFITFDGVNYPNGRVLVVTNNTTHTISATPCAGYSLLGLNTTGGLSVIGSLLIANGSGTLTAVFEPGGASAFVAFLTDPSSCGTIYLNGLTYHNSNFTSVPPGSVYPISASPCTNYGFLGWKVTSISNQGISIVGGMVYINASGSITAVFRPLVTVILYTQPSGCGTILLGGTPYANNAVATVTSEVPYSLAALPCPHYVLGSWINTSGALLNGGLVEFIASSVLTAVFVVAHYPVLVLVNPTTCGTLHVGGTPASNGTTLSLAYGNYSVSATPCTGDHLTGVQTTGEVLLNGSTLFVNGSGTLSASFAPVPPVVRLSVPASTLSGAPVVLYATVGTPVPPYNYSYQWSFGDGAQATTPANFTSHAYDTPGIYLIRVNVTDPYHRSAQANETIDVVAPSVSASGVPWTSVAIAVGIVAAAVVAIVVGAYLVRRRGPPPDSTEPAPVELAPEEAPAALPPGPPAPIPDSPEP